MLAISSNDGIYEVLVSLRQDYPELLKDLERGDRAFWVGSGVSRDQVPGLESLIRKVLIFLRDQAAEGCGTDPHLQTLERIVDEHLPSELEALRREPRTWAPPEDLSALVTSYSQILSQEVSGKPEDYLLWNAVDVRNTYGSPSIEPGPEHFLLAIMVHEGVLEYIVTTNWDGLIERAVSESQTLGSIPPLAVKMSDESFRTERGRCSLYKVHGCAVQARNDECFREYLVANVTHIAIWLSNSKIQMMVDNLKQMARVRRSLLLGLSMQDYNLLASLAAASQAQPWPWNKENPAYLFAEPSIQQSQRDVLKIAYSDDYAECREEVCERSATGTFSGLLLAASTLHVVFGKLKAAIDHAATYAGSEAVVDALKLGITSIETGIAQSAGNDAARVVALLKSGLSSLTRRFFEPQRDLVGHEYMPIHASPVLDLIPDPVRNLNIPELAVALGLLGMGAARGHWEIGFRAEGPPGNNGIIALTPLRRASSTALAVVITRDATATDAMKATAVWTSCPDDVLVIQATGERPKKLTRGLDGGIGSGRRSVRPRRQAWLADMASAAGRPDDFLNAFRAGVSV